MVLIVVPPVYIFLFFIVLSRGSLLLAKYNKIAVRHFVLCIRFCLSVCVCVCFGFRFLAKSKLSANVNGSYGLASGFGICQQKPGHLGVLMLQ